MKKLFGFVLLATLLLTSCNLFLQQDYGKLIIDLKGSQHRALNAQDLPEFSTAKMDIEITGTGIEPIKKSFAKNAQKKFSASFPVATKLTIKISIITDTAIWTDEKEHTITAGDNNVKIKLKKTAVALKPFGFSITNNDDTATLTIEIAGKTINKNNVSKDKTHKTAFTRDGKGRLYVTYHEKTSNEWKIKRYNSEGEDEKDITNLPSGSGYMDIAFDPVTGQVYVARNGDLYLIDDNGAVSTSKLKSSSLYTDRIAIYNNFLFRINGQGNLQMYKIEENSVSSVGEEITFPPNLITITGAANNPTIDYKDIFVTEKKIYILFSALKTNNVPYCSLGGILEYSYTDAGISTNTPKEIGFTKTLPENGSIVTTPANDFYGAVQFLGYKDDIIYIADEGFTFKNEGGIVEKDEYKNRLVEFNTKTRNPNFKPTEYKWFVEKEETTPPPPPTPAGKVILWEKNSVATLGMKYYQVDAESYTSPLPEPFIKNDTSGENTTTPTDVFCFDKDGNLYVLTKYKKNSFIKFKIHRHLLLETGDYATSFSGNNDFLLDHQATPGNLNIQPTAIAVHTTDNADNYLYYTYKEGNTTYIKRLKWTTTLSSSYNDTSFLITIDDDTLYNIKFSCTAMAANEGKFFFARKSEFTSPPLSYSINIYKGTDTGYDSTHPCVYVNNTAHSSGDNFIDQDITNMCIKENNLYIIGLKQKGQMNKNTTTTVSISGDLHKLNNLSSALPSGLGTALWPGGSVDDGFAPYRFIYTAENKLIIASDGYTGDISNQDQKNKVLSFDIQSENSWSLTSQNDTDAEFSRKLEYSSKFTWE